MLEIDLQALEHNFNFLSRKAGPGVKRMAVVKAFGYGSEVVEVSRKFVEMGAEYLAVAFPSEGIELRQAGIRLPILVFQSQPHQYESLIENCLEPSLYSERSFREFTKLAEARGQKEYPVHIKFNTGLNRLGFSEKETALVYELLSGTAAVRAASFFSHLAASWDWQEREFTLEQIYSFRRIAVELYQKLDYEPLLHICNTSGIINYPEAAFHMVRMGIGLYGYGNEPSVDQQLKPVATLKTVISQIHDLEVGESVGYDRTFRTELPTRTATLPIGYADGISRKYGNQRAGVIVNGQYAPIIGNICMDMLMIDITNIACEEGDEVVIFGAEQHGSEFARAGETIPYELLTGIDQRVKRIILP